MSGISHCWSDQSHHRQTLYSRPAESGEFELLMPDAKPKVAETYLCTTIRLDENNTYYVTGFNPRAEMGTAHHMLLFGCEVRER